MRKSGSVSTAVKQLAVVVGALVASAAVVMTIGALTVPDPPPPFVAADADTEGLPSPEELNQAGAVIVLSGGAIDDGVVESRYELEGTGAQWNMVGGRPEEGTEDFRFGGSRTLRLSWEWVDGEAGGAIEDVRATLSLPRVTLYARDGECDLDLHTYQPYREVEELTYDDGRVEELVREGVEVAGTLDCENLTGVGLEAPISYQAVFRAETRFISTG